MTELESCIETAKQTGKIAVCFEAVKEEQTKFSMDLQGVRLNRKWAYRIKLGDGSTWTREAREVEMIAVVEEFYAFFMSMGRERARA